MKNPSKWLMSFVLWIVGIHATTLAQPANQADFKESRFGFIENNGQIKDQFNKPNQQVKFLLPMEGFNVQLSSSGFSYDTYVPDANGSLNLHRVDIVLVNANPSVLLIAKEQTPEVLNFYVDGVTDVRSYNEVLYQNIYEGIDLVFKAKPGIVRTVEYDFIVHPGADASQIKLQYTGAFNTKLENEKISLSLVHGVLSESIPESFLAETKLSIAVSYEQLAPNVFAFHVPEYDKSQTLVIDPNPDRTWATYFGGTLIDRINGVTVDGSGNVYITGVTSSAASIASTGSHQTTISTATDAFVAKFNASGVRQWASYYGGSGNDSGDAIALDASANIYVAGVTASTNNIASSGAFKSTLSGTSDAFLVKFNTSGVRQFATYFGGTGTETALALAVSGTAVYFGGETSSSSGVASTSPFLATLQGGAYLASFTTAGARNWSTYYPGTEVMAIAVDGSGNVIFGGETNAAQTGLATTHQTTYGGGVSDGFLVKFTSAGARSWGTYFGGSSQDRIRAIDTDALNSIFVGGYAASTSGISTGSEVFGASFNGGTGDGFIAKFSSSGVQEFGMYIGNGTVDEQIFALNVRPDNSIYFGGGTNGAYATTGAYQTTNGGSNDMFIGKFDPNFSHYGSPIFPRLWATNYGGSGSETLLGMATSGTSTNTRVYLAGQTSSTTNVVSTGSHQTTFGGSTDGLLAVFTDCGVPGRPGAISLPTTICTGQQYTISVGAAYNASSYEWLLPSGWTGTSSTNSITVTTGTTGGAINVRAVNSCGNSPYTAISAAITPLLAQPGAITGSTSVCQGTSQTYSISPVSGASSYTWTLPAGWTGTSTTTSITATVGPNIGAITVAANNACGIGAVRSIPTVLVTPIPAQPSVITGDAAVCQGASKSFGVTNIPGTTYAWTLPAGWSGTSTSNGITATVGANGGTISVIPSNGCGSGPARTFTVDVSNGVSSQPGSVTGNTTVCVGSSQTYSIAAVGGATSYSWSVAGTGWSGTSTSTSFTPTVGTSNATISVYAINGCGNSVVRQLSITTITTPTQPSAINGLPDDFICSGGSRTYSVTNVAGMTYAWTLPSGWSGTSTTNSINIVAGNTSGSVSVSASNACGTSTARTLGITVGNAPATPTVSVAPNSVCQGAGATYGVNPLGGADSYTWTLPSGWSGSSIGPSIAVTAGALGGNITVTANNANCGSSASLIIPVTIGSLPETPGAINGSALVCQGTTNTYSVATVAGATSYTWTLPSGWSGSSTTNNITTTASTTNGNITVRANNSCGNSANQSLAVTTTSVPAQPSAIVGSIAPTQGVAESYSVTNVPGTTYTWAAGANSSITGSGNAVSITWSAVGTRTVSVTPSNACGTGTLITLIVNVTTNDVTPPAIASLNPVNTGMNLPVDGNLVAIFSENISAVNSKVVAIKRVSDNTVFESYTLPSANVGIGSNSITINPTGNFVNSTTYYVTMDVGTFLDAAGNPFAGIANSSVWSFTTAAAAPQNQTITFNALAAKTFGDAAFALTATASSGLPVSYASSNTSVATISGSTVTIVGVGSTTITASQGGNGSFNAATNIQQTLTISKANQTITFGALAAKTFGDVNFVLGATASSALGVSYTSSNPAVATISGNTVTIVGAGSTSITASQSGNANFNAAANVQQTLTVNKANQTITFGTLPGKQVGDAAFGLAATTSSGLAISYSSSNAAVATISGSTVTVVGAGSTTITASQAGNTNFNAATNVQQTLTVTNAAPAMAIQSLTPADNATGVDGSIDLSITFNQNVGIGSGTISILRSDNDALVTSLSNFSGAITISGATVTFNFPASIPAGTAVHVNISAGYLRSAADGSNTFAGISDKTTWNFTVGKLDQTITFNSLASKTFGDANFGLTATASSGLAISYASSNTSVATISGSAVTIVGAGSTTITASQSGNATFNAAANVQQVLTVNKANQSITFGALASKTFGDANFMLSATASSSLGVSYSSSNTSVATVSGNTVTIVGAGSTTITASQAGNANFNAATNVQQTLTVNKANQTITFNTLAAKTFGDANFTLNATASSSLTVSYSSSNTSVATVSGNTVTIVGTGSTTITATQSGNANFNSATNVQQNLTVNKANQTITFNDIPAKTVGDPSFTLSATANSGLSVSFVSSNTAVATVNGNTVTIVGAGSTIITASQGGNTNYNAAISIDKTLVVSNPAKQNQTITFGALATKTFGDTPFNLAGIASSGLSVSYSSSNTAVATISGNIVTIVGAGSAIIAANQAGNDTFNPANSVQQTLTVNKANQTITFGTLASKTFGDVNLLLTGTASSSLEIAYTSSNTAVATVNGNTVTIIGAGSTTITATQGGNTNFNAASSVGRTLTVNRADQTIMFGSLAAKSISDPPFSLNATASSGLAVSYSSSNTAVVTISGSTVTIVGAGSTTITASQTGNTNFNAALSVQQSLTVISQTRNISLSGNMAFGELIVPESVTRVLTISNTGTATLNISNITYPAGFSVDKTSGTVAAGGSLTVTVTLTASEAVTYSGNIVVASDATSGTGSIEVSGTGVLVTGSEPNLSRSLNVYPNPGTGIFTIEILKPLSKSVSVCDQAGRAVMTVDLEEESEGRYTLNINQQAQGLYFVKVQTKWGLKVVRIMKI